ncbi:MAG: Uma2 family endonuclease [Planctomycetota bacterium]|nr:Uma2 family endonuclease [Planctomycetota bacterium]
MSTQTTRHALPDHMFPGSDGMPMETNKHLLQMNLLTESIRVANDVFGIGDYIVGGNNFIYYDPMNPRKNVGPDCFYIKNIPFDPTWEKWKVWEQNDRYPDVIFEMLSKTTRKKDEETNKAIYEQVFETPEYYYFDPLKLTFKGWQLVAGEYIAMKPDERGWLWSEQLGVWVGQWHGSHVRYDTTWLRFYFEDGSLVPTREEIQQQQTQRAEAEATRADEAEAELARLRKLLSKQATHDNSDD